MTSMGRLVESVRSGERSEYLAYDCFGNLVERREIGGGYNEVYGFTMSETTNRITSGMELLEKLLSIERDPNWRGHFFHLRGAEKLLTRDYSGAVSCFLEADRQFNPSAANFTDVSSPYCRTRFEIISEKWRDEGDDEKVIEYALSVLAWKNDDTFSQYEEMVLLNCLGFAFASLAEDKGFAFFDRLALQVRLAALDFGRENPDQLAYLFLSYLAVRDRKGCLAVLEDLASVQAEKKRIEKLESLLAHHLPADSDTSGTP